MATTSVSTRSPGSLNPTRQQLDELDALLQRMLDLPVHSFDGGDSDEEVPAPPMQAAPPPMPAPRPPEPRPVAAPPVSYMVVETASPRPLPPASGFEPSPAGLSMRLLPVTPEEDDQAEEEPAAAPAPAVPPAQTPAVDPPSAEGGAWVPLRSTWQPSAQTWQPLAQNWQQANALANPMAPPRPEPVPPREVVLPAPAPAPVPVEFVIERTPPAAAPPAPAAAPMPAAPPAEPRLTLSAEDAPVPTLLLPLVWFNQGFDACLAPLGAPGRWLCGRRGRRLLGAVGLMGLGAAAAIAVSAGMGWIW